MIDLNQIQEDVYGLLMSLPQLAQVNIVMEKKFLTDFTLEMDAVWQTVRGGKSGCGILIEEPEISCEANNVSGPPQSILLSFVSFQNGDAAFTESGPKLFASWIEQMILDALHLINIGGVGTVQVTPQFSGPARDYEGINARRTKLNVKCSRVMQSQRTAPVTASLSGDQLTLACATPGASIYFTTDSSFPSNAALALSPLPAVDGTLSPVNVNSQLYTAPITVANGMIVRAAAYCPPLNPGAVLRAEIQV